MSHNGLMTTAYKAKYLERIAQVSSDLETLRRVEMEIAAGGTASASLSSGGGSKSYTRLDLGKIAELIRSREAELVQLRSRLNGQGPIRRIMFTR